VHTAQRRRQILSIYQSRTRSLFGQLVVLRAAYNLVAWVCQRHWWRRNIAWSSTELDNDDDGVAPDDSWILIGAEGRKRATGGRYSSTTGVGRTTNDPTDTRQTSLPVSSLPPKLTLMSSLASAAAPSPHHDDDDIKLIGSRQWPIEDYGNVKAEGGLQGVCITKRPARWGWGKKPREMGAWSGSPEDEQFCLSDIQHCLQF